MDTQDYLTPLTRSPSVEARKTALVVVDMQYATGSPDHGLGRMLKERGEFEAARWRFDRLDLVAPNIRRLIDAFHANGHPVVYTQQGAEKADYRDATPIIADTFRATNNHAGTREHEILDELKPTPADYVVRKTSVGAFSSSNIDSLLRSLGIEVLVFVGYSTNMCVDLTARVAADLGYRCILVEDGCGAAREEYHRYAVMNFQRLFGRVASTDQVLSEVAALGSVPVVK